MRIPDIYIMDRRGERGDHCRSKDTCLIFIVPGLFDKHCIFLEQWPSCRALDKDWCKKILNSYLVQADARPARSSDVHAAPAVLRLKEYSITS